jgi:hypothetical protein
VSSLREFLASEAEKLRGERSEATRKREEWTSSVQRLLDRIKDWLVEADTEKVLTLNEGRTGLREAGIGDYEAPFLVVGIGARQVAIRPIARFVAGPLSSTGAIHVLKSYGRVDMQSALEKCMLFRTETTPGDRWVIIEEDGYRSQPFDRESFESAFRRLLE